MYYDIPRYSKILKRYSAPIAEISPHVKYVIHFLLIHRVVLNDFCEYFTPRSLLLNKAYGIRLNRVTNCIATTPCSFSNFFLFSTYCSASSYFITLLNSVNCSVYENVFYSLDLKQIIRVNVSRSTRYWYAIQISIFTQLHKLDNFQKLSRNTVKL